MVGRCRNVWDNEHDEEGGGIWSHEISIHLLMPAVEGQARPCYCFAPYETTAPAGTKPSQPLIGVTLRCNEA